MHISSFWKSPWKIRCDSVNNFFQKKVSTLHLQFMTFLCKASCGQMALSYWGHPPKSPREANRVFQMTFLQVVHSWAMTSRKKFHYKSVGKKISHYTSWKNLHAQTKSLLGHPHSLLRIEKVDLGARKEVFKKDFFFCSRGTIFHKSFVEFITWVTTHKSNNKAYLVAY